MIVAVAVLEEAIVLPEAIVLNEVAVLDGVAVLDEAIASKGASLRGGVLRSLALLSGLTMSFIQ